VLIYKRLIIKLSRLFDRDYYLANNPDVVLSDIDPLNHFIQFGGTEGRDPGPYFSSAWYLTSNEDVKNFGINPLVHYLMFGKKEKRGIKPAKGLDQLALICSSGLFDEEFYLANNPDVAQAQIDPLEHYLYYGGFEGRDPNPDFNSRYYLKIYKDVKSSGLNPLVHFVIYGKKEGRHPKGNISINVDENGFKTLLSNIKNSTKEKTDDKSINFRFSPIPKITVCVLCYNHEEFIADCLEGILTQKGRFKIELIIADDCSLDKTIEVIESYMYRFTKKGIIVNLLTSTKNIGAHKNAEGFRKYFTGDFIAVCDGDDYWIDPLKLQAQIEFLYSHPSCSSCFHDLLLFDQNSQKFSLHPSQQRLTTNFLTTKDIILDYSIGNASSCMYNAKLIQRNPCDYTVNEDWNFNIYYSQFGPIGHLNEIMSVYRQHDKGIWSGLSKIEQMEGLIIEIDRFNKYLGFRYDTEFKQLKKQVNQSLESNKNMISESSSNECTHRTNILLDEMQLRDVDLIRSSRLFNSTFYINNNPDVEKSKVEPAVHYYLFGGFEGRNPSDEFSSSDYLKINKDVESANINPLVHYLRYGEKEKRQTEDFDHVYIDKIISKSVKSSVCSRPDETIIKKYKNILSNYNNKEFQLVQIEGKLWVLKPNLHFSDIQRELLGYSLAKDIVNAAEVRPISFNIFNRLINLDLLPPDASPTNTLLCRFVQDYLLHELPLKTLDLALAGEFVFSLWIRRHDPHSFNRGYVENIPIFFDYQASLNCEDWLFDIDRFFQETSPGYGGSWRVTEWNDRILTTHESRKEDFPENIIYSKKNFNEAIDLITNEILSRKFDIREKVKEAGFFGIDINKISDFLEKARNELPNDIDRLRDILFKID